MVGPASLAAHDERARKNGYEQKTRRIELAKALLTSLFGKLNCAFYCTCYVTTKLGGGQVRLLTPEAGNATATYELHTGSALGFYVGHCLGVEVANPHPWS